MDDNSKNHPWEVETHVSKPMYRVESTDGYVSYVVADGFDDAVRRVHHYHWQHREWPFTCTDAVTETPVYDRVCKVSLFSHVIL